MKIAFSAKLYRRHLESPDGREGTDNHYSLLVVDWPKGWRVPEVGEGISWAIDERTSIIGTVDSVMWFKEPSDKARLSPANDPWNYEVQIGVGR